MIQKNTLKVYVWTWIIFLSVIFCLVYKLQYSIELANFYDTIFWLLILFMYWYYSILWRYKTVISFLFITALLVVFQAIAGSNDAYYYSYEFIFQNSIIDVLSLLLLFPFIFIDACLNIWHDWPRSLEFKSGQPRFEEWISYIIYLIYLGLWAFYSLYSHISSNKNIWIFANTSQRAGLYLWLWFIFVVLSISTFSTTLFSSNFLLYIYQIMTIWWFWYFFIVGLLLLVFHDKFKIFYTILWIWALNFLLVWFSVKNIITIWIYYITVILPLYFSSYIINSIFDSINMHYYNSWPLYWLEYVSYLAIIVLFIIYSFIKKLKMK